MYINYCCTLSEMVDFFSCRSHSKLDVTYMKEREYILKVHNNDPTIIKGQNLGTIP